MKRVIIATGGTSLLTEWKRKNHDGNPSVDDLLVFLEHSETVCAETHSLSKLEFDKAQDFLYLVSSETPEGKLCMEAIEKHFLARGYTYISTIAVSGLNFNYYDFENRGLPNLLKTFSTIFQDNPGVKIVINATGGFKAQTSFATLFGIVFGIEVVYLFETFKELLSFPPMPLSCNRTLIEHYGETFNGILYARSNAEAREHIKSLPESLRGFFHKQNGRYEYSPIGSLFLKAMENPATKRSCIVRTYKNHASLWGDAINDIKDISDRVVRTLFQRIFDSSDAVQTIYFDEMVHRKSQEVHLQYVETVNHSLKYLLQTPGGSQYIKVEILPGYENKVLQRLGKRIYP